MYLFNRTINIAVTSPDQGGTLVVNGIFLDSHHEVCVTLQVDVASNRLTAAQGELRRAPRDDCYATAGLLPKLAGLELASGVRRQVLEAVGSGQGCTHLADLVLECIKGVVQARFRLLRLTLTPQEIQARLNDELAGTCYAFRPPTSSLAQD